MRIRNAALTALATATASTAAYFFFVRPRHLRWGATDEDIARPLPGGQEIEEPNYVTTRAIAINASPDEIWPWLAQMGELPRGGFYSFTGIEKLLGLRVENATTILPEFQQLEVGQDLARDGNMLVKAFEPEKYLVLGPEDSPDQMIRWSLELHPAGSGQTRLVSRVRAHLKTSPSNAVMRIVLDPGHLLMESRMLHTIKRRVEEDRARRAHALSIAMTS